MEVATIEIDNKEYTIVDIREGYTYLVNFEDTNDFLIMKEDGDDLVSITDQDEYVKALMVFGDKITG